MGRLSIDLTASLNFYPYYEKLLRERRKTKTIRLGEQTSRYPKEKLLTLTCGWTPRKASVLGQIKVLDSFSAPIRSLKDADLEGESPDCLRVEAIPYVLSAIYGKVVTEDEMVTVIRWAYVE